MKRFTFSDMNRGSGEILETALVEPVVLTKHGKEKLVILAADAYKRMQGQPHVTAYSIADMPDDVYHELMEGLDAILAEEDDA
jgi:prevent-host-death family protein